MNNKRIVLLGAKSFIGRNFLKNFSNYNIMATSRNLPTNLRSTSNFRWIECDLLNINAIENVLKRDDVVINCAYSNNYQNDNIKMIENIIKIANKKSISKLIHLSSAVVMGGQDSQIISESHECKPITKYQKEKYVIEQILFNSDTNFNLIILRPTAVFGEGGKNLLKNMEEINKDGALLKFLKNFILGNRHMHLVSVENVIKAIDFFIKKESIGKNIFFVSQDSDKLNYYKNISNEISFIIRGCSYTYFKDLSIPNFFLKILFRILGKRYEEISSIYSTNKIEKEGFILDKDLKNSLKSFVNKK